MSAKVVGCCFFHCIKNNNLFGNKYNEMFFYLRLRKMAQTSIINPDWDFTKLGIGGLDDEFSGIFRRAFASRVFPPDVIEQLGKKNFNIFIPFIKAVNYLFFLLNLICIMGALVQ